MIQDAWFTSKQFRLVTVILLAAAITFVNDIELFRHPWMLLFIGLVTVILGIHNVTNDLGIFALMICLFVLVYNIQVMDVKKK
jgi:uncharacterized membrane protein